MAEERAGSQRRGGGGKNRKCYAVVADGARAGGLAEERRFEAGCWTVGGWFLGLRQTGGRRLIGTTAWSSAVPAPEACRELRRRVGRAAGRRRISAGW